MAIKISGSTIIDDSRRLLNVGLSTFSGNIDANGNLDVDGDTELDNLNVSGITTLAGNIFLGEGGSDQINVNGNFISGLDPLSHNLYDLGTNGKNWRDGNFAGIVTSTGLNISGIVTATSFVGDGSALTNLPAATTIPVTDESSDTQNFLVFTNSATGNQAPKTGSNLTFNASSGLLYATQFVGDGSSLTNVDAATLDSIDSASFLRSDATDIFTGTSLTFNDNKTLYFGTDNDGQIYFDGSNLLVQGGSSGSTYLRGSTVNISTNGGSGGYSPGILVDETGGGDARVRLQYAGNTKLETTNTGVTVTGTVSATTFSGSGASLTNLPASTTITVADESSDTTCFPLFATAATGDLAPKSGSNLTFNSSTGALTATSFSGDLTGTVNTAAQTNITSLGTLSALNVSGISTLGLLKVQGSVDTVTLMHQYAGASEVHFKSLSSAQAIDYTFFGASNHTIADLKDGGSVDLYYDSNKKFETKSDGIDVTGEVQCDSLDVDGAADITGDITANGNIVGDNSTNISGINSVTATKFVGDGSELTGIAAGGSAEFNTGITSTVQATPLSFETTMHTFPSTSGRQYVIESINVANVDESVGVGTTVNIIASIQDATAAEQTYIAYNVPIVTGGVIELLKNPIVAGPSDVIRMWTTNDDYVGVNNAADVYINYAEHESTDFISKFAATTTINSTDAVTLYTSTSNPTMIEKIGFANRTDTGDFPISIKVTSGTTTSYLAKNLIIPRYSTVDILDRPKRIETNAKIEVEVGSTSTIDVIIAGKKITS